MGEESEAKKGGVLFIWKERGGEGFRGGEAGWCTPMQEGVVGKGGGAKYFFSGPKCPPNFLYVFFVYWFFSSP